MNLSTVFSCFWSRAICLVLIYACSSRAARRITTSSTVPTTTTTTITTTEYPNSLKSIGWLVGKWRSEFGGKVNWPTVPTMTYGEEVEFQIAPISYGCAGHFLSYSASGWSHSTRDHFLDMYGYLIQDDDFGNVTFLTVANNGFTTIESGKSSQGHMTLRLKEIGRIAIARDIPVEDLYRQYRLVDKDHMEQVLLMRTATHPAEKTQMLEHTRVVYQRVKPQPTTTTVTTTSVFTSTAQTTSLLTTAHVTNFNSTEETGRIRFEPASDDARVFAPTTALPDNAIVNAASPASAKIEENNNQTIIVSSSTPLLPVAIDLLFNDSVPSATSPPEFLLTTENENGSLAIATLSHAATSSEHPETNFPQLSTASFPTDNNATLNAAEVPAKNTELILQQNSVNNDRLIVATSAPVGGDSQEFVTKIVTQLPSERQQVASIVFDVETPPKRDSFGSDIVQSSQSESRPASIVQLSPTAQR